MSLEAVGLACVRGERQLFRDVHFQLIAGDALCVAGANGSGKTSLLRMLCGLSIPAEGMLQWNGKEIRKDREAYAKQLMYLGHANGMKDELLAWENVLISTALSGQVISRDRAYDALDQFGLEQEADLPTRVLSQGQRKRVALARLAFSTQAPLWILDEPFTALDLASLTHLCAILENHLRAGGMLIYTTHQTIALQAHRSLTLDLAQSRLC
ncbi:cytochrome c biogenesis heme-transporting ATPase CcmA [Undibacterium sp.]|uniref:cytochrome c biogenesis heme-transporting ATPase CcmA n=1 Tax=Undibacterium sp. TaxID=1914977 RepID=UPI0037503E07